jgi:hypothetical protein
MHDGHAPADGAGQKLSLVLFWAFVGIPLLWGVSQTIANAAKMFQ